MNLEQYKAFLRTVDWTSQYSDSHHVYAKGRRGIIVAEKLATTDEQFWQAYKEAKK